jgi:hypothetical protein
VKLFGKQIQGRAPLAQANKSRMRCEVRSIGFKPGIWQTALPVQANPAAKNLKKPSR